MVPTMYKTLTSSNAKIYYSYYHAHTSDLTIKEQLYLNQYYNS